MCSFEAVSLRARVLRVLLPVLAGVGVVLGTPSAVAATFVVNSRLDNGSGGCTATECTLREAITAANATSAADTINFAFSTNLGAEILIQPATRLPTITQPLSINGYSVAGAAVNTHPFRSDAVIRIRLDGALAGEGTPGLAVCANNVSVRGLAFTRFGFAGISFGQDNATIDCGTITGGIAAGNFFGLTTDGSTVAGNGRFGVLITGSAVTLGGSAAADRNVISGNLGNGIQVQEAGTSGTRIEGNLIGTDRSGRQRRGNGVAGILTTTLATDLTIGSAAAPNRIAFNGTGIHVANTSARVRLANNHFILNEQLGINLLGTAGVDPNDNSDADSGGNALQNFLDGFFATRVDGGIRVQGSLRRAASGGSLSYTIAAYAASSCNASGHGEGELIGSAIAVTSGATAPIDVTIATSNPPRAGAFISTTVTSPAGETSEFSACAPLDPPPLVVTSTADTDGSTCGASCTLRQAINASNASAGPKVISFNIPGDGERMIQPTSPLPTLITPVTIDGYTQPGTQVNTDPVASNAVLRIRLDGRLAGSNANAISVCANDVLVRGLAITDFDAHALVFGSSNAGTLCDTAREGGAAHGNFIGLASDGSSLAGNGGAGVLALGARVRVGSIDVADRNVIGGNGIGVSTLNSQSAGSQVLGNLIGTDRSGQLDRGNNAGGVELGVGTTDVDIGSVDAPNTIRFNLAGLRIRTTGAQRTRFAANHYDTNDQLGIDLFETLGGAPGPNPNDAGDADSGSNGLQNFPELQLAELVDGSLRQRGRLELPPGTVNGPYRIAAYASVACDASGFGEGERFLGQIEASLTQSTGGNFDLVFGNVGALQPGVQITATATGPEGTSEFSACLAATAAPPGIVVNSIADPGTGGCTLAECTLREAIALANGRPGADLIRFDLSGSGPFRITLPTTLPAISEALTIDGYTQAGAARNAAAIGSDATLMIELRGAGPAVGIATCASDVIVRGLAINGFSSAAIVTRADPQGSCTVDGSNVRIEGNFIGLQPDGSTFGNGIGIAVRDTQVHIGGAALEARNVISDNNVGVRVSGAQSAGSRIENNLIGTGPSATTARGNSLAGIEIESTSNLLIGGDGTLRNLLAFNGNGVLVQAGAGGNRLLNNEFRGNTALAIDLSTGSNVDGPTANDLNDADTGGNTLQNFPVLSGGASIANSVTVEGLLDVPAGIVAPLSYTLAFYESAACGGNGRGEGDIFIDARAVDFLSNAENFSVSLPITPRPGRVISATATDPAGNTSELSNCFVTPAPPQAPGIFADSFERR